MSGMTALSPCYTPEAARQLSPLQLAFIGDGVHSLLVRSRLIGQNLKVKDMHVAATQAVNAASQYRALQKILPLLTDEETDIMRRGRNAHARHSAPKSASTGEYAGATGLEALLGYLYLIGDTGRIIELSAYLCGEE